MLLSIPVGTTSKIIEFPVFDSSSTVGATLAGLVNNSSGMVAYYNRDGAAGGATVMSLVSMTKGTWTSLGFIAVDGTNMPGWYQLGIPDAALAAGAKYVTIMIKGATNQVPVCIVIELTATSNQDSAAGGMSSVSAIKTQTDKLAFTVANQVDSNVLDWKSSAAPAMTGDAYAVANSRLPAALTGNGNMKSSLLEIISTLLTESAGGRLKAAWTTFFDVASPTLTTADVNQTGDSYARLGLPSGANIEADIAAINAKTTNLPASPAAVGSNMGTVSSVTGSVASIAAGGINNAAFNADVASTAYASNILAQMLYKFFDNAFTGYADGSTFTANGLLDRLTKLMWILRNKIAVTDANGNTIVYKDDNSTTGISVSAALTDDSTTTTRLRMA